jgi:enoyl-CoA hydratase/carnithine racemase
MARPRVHAPDALRDAAEKLLVEQGRARLTVRALAAEAGASNGSIYHAFGSLETLVASAWLRRARQFLDLQRRAVEGELAAGDVRRAVQTAADAPALLAEQGARADPPTTGGRRRRHPRLHAHPLGGTAMPTLDRHGDVYVLDLGDTENRFHPDWIASVNAALDEVEKAEGPRALVTAATGKFFSNGLDLDWLFAHAEQHEDYVISVHDLLARVLALPVVTVAALQGHTFAAGAMLSLAHDFRVMRADRGFWCLPEADIGIPFTRGMSALIQARLSPQTAHEAMTTARRYGGEDAVSAAVVDRAVDEESVRTTAVELARSLAGKAGPTLGTIKARMYAPVLDVLGDRTDPRG